MQDQLASLCALALRHHDPATLRTALPRVGISVSATTTRVTPSIYQPRLCLVLQGAKQVQIGERLLRYDTASYFVGSIDLPASGCVIEASATEPYVCVSMALDHDAVVAMLADVEYAAQGDGSAFGVCPVTPELLDSFQRMLGLLDTPGDIAVLAPLVEREILYRLLQGPQGAVLRQAASADSRLTQVRAAIHWVRDHFDQPLKVEDLAEIAGMSIASFHRHFKAATAMSPLQYQKCLRLQQARQLLIARSDAARAAYAVGYESASQFSREYARMFGAPPSRDAERLRGETLVAAAA